MNALYIICGLGIASLIAEIVNLKKWLVVLVTIGIATAAAVATLDWNTTNSYFNDMVMIDNISIAFTVLICLSAVLWFWLSHDWKKNGKSFPLLIKMPGRNCLSPRTMAL